MFGKRLRELWPLDPRCVFLNHGSFGACPRPVLAAQSRYRARLESQPLRFYLREYAEALDTSRRRLEIAVGATSGQLAFVTNATTGVNTVLRGLDLRAGDELLVTDQAYGACRNAMEFVAARAGATVQVVQLPWPLKDAGEVTQVVLQAVGPRTRFALLDHITSATALVLPVADMVAALRERGVLTMVDGAHAPGQLPLNIGAIGAHWYTGNCHKWFCAPKGAAFLHADDEVSDGTRPLVISHGAGLHWGDRPRFRREFDWQGTADPSAYLAVADALDFLASLAPGGVGAAMGYNRQLALDARALLCDALEVDPPCPADMVGSMAALPLGAAAAHRHKRVLASEPLQDALFEAGIEVPIVRFPSDSQRLVRISAQVYNCMDDYRQLAKVLYKILAH